MPGVTKYNLVDDAHDLRIPMHNDEVFKHGVSFEAKVRNSVVLCALTPSLLSLCPCPPHSWVFIHLHTRKSCFNCYMMM